MTSDSLRMRVVEAGARAIWDEWEALDDYEALDADGKANALADIEIVLDAMLSCLTENADEWGKQAWFHAGKREHLPSLLAVLREDR